MKEYKNTRYILIYWNSSMAKRTQYLGNERSLKKSLCLTDSWWKKDLPSINAQRWVLEKNRHVFHSIPSDYFNFFFAIFCTEWKNLKMIKPSLSTVLWAKDKFSSLFPFHLYPFSFENWVYLDSQNPLATCMKILVTLT